MVGTLRRGCEGGKEIPGRAGRGSIGRLRNEVSIQNQLAQVLGCGGPFCRVGHWRLLPSSYSKFLIDVFKEFIDIFCKAHVSE